MAMVPWAISASNDGWTAVSSSSAAARKARLRRGDPPSIQPPETASPYRANSNPPSSAAISAGRSATAIRPVTSTPVVASGSASARKYWKRYGSPAGTIPATALLTATPASVSLLAATRSAPVIRSARSRAAVSRCAWSRPATRSITSRNIAPDAVAIISASSTPPRRSSTSRTMGAISAATDMATIRRPLTTVRLGAPVAVSSRIDGCSADSAVAV